MTQAKDISVIALVLLAVVPATILVLVLFLLMSLRYAGCVVWLWLFGEEERAGISDHELAKAHRELERNSM